jgi:hypothetical protein
MQVYKKNDKIYDDCAASSRIFDKWICVIKIVKLL